MTTNPINTTENHYTRRIANRIIPLVLLIIVAFTVMNIISVIVASRSNVQNDHQLGLAQVTTALETEMEHYIADISELSRDSQLRSYALGRNLNILAATSLARDLINEHSGEYRSIRYLSRTGVVLLESRNVRGVAIAVPLNQIGEVDPIAYNNPAFQDLVTGRSSQIAIGDFELLRDENDIPVDPPSLELRIFAPVYADNGTFLTGIIELYMDADTILNNVNVPDLDLRQNELSGRRVMLLNRENYVVADQGITGSAYLNTIENPGGNTGFNDVFQRVTSAVSALSLRDNLSMDFLGGLGGSVVTSRPISFSGAASVGWTLVFVDSTLQAFQESLFAIGLMIFISIVFSVLAIYLIRRLLDRQLQPIAAADALATQIASGQRPATIAARSGDDLLSNVNSIANQIETLSESLGSQVARRNRDLQVAGRIGREAATLDDLDTLLRRAINLICNELGFYHAQVFLLDDLGRDAVLAYSRGEAGRQMLEQEHALPVGSKTVIGTVTGERRPVIVNDTTVGTDDIPHGFNPLLPETRAEMGLPLIIGQDVIGAIDIQSRDANVFLTEDIPTFQLLADQLAIAIYNARLKQATQHRLSQIDKLNRQLTREAWAQAQDMADLKTEYGKPAKPDQKGRVLSAPIRIRQETIGTIDAALGEDQDFSEGEQMILTAVAERVALAIENARLFQETQATLSETSTLYQLSRRLNEASTLEDVIHAIIVTVSPEASGGQVWLFDEYISSENPEIVRLSVDLPLVMREVDSESLLGIQLNVREHALFQRFSPLDVLTIDDVSQEVDIDVTLATILDMLEARALVLIPLNMRGSWKGFISIEFREPRRFTERDDRVYRALIGQAGVSIDNRLLMEQTEEALTRQEKLYAASRIINTAQALQDLVYAAVATTTDEHLDFWLSLLSTEIDDTTRWPRTATIIAQSNDGIVGEASIQHRVIMADDSPLYRREPLILFDEGDSDEDASESLRWLRSFGLRFMAIFPLFSDNTPIALFYIVSKEYHKLTDDDYDVYRALTGQMSTQIQNRRLLQRSEEALAETRRLYIASRTIAAAPDMTSVYDAVAGHLAMPFLEAMSDPVDISISILLAKPEPSPNAPTLEYDYQWQSDPMKTPTVPQGVAIDHAQVPFGSVLTNITDGALIYRDGRSNADLPENVVNVLTQDGLKYASAAPLKTASRWFGVLIVRTNTAGLLDEGYDRFLLAISDQIANAIERQQLYQEAIAERENLDAILSTMPTGVLVLDPYTFVPIQRNERVEELFGQQIDLNEPFTSERYSLYRTGTRLYYPNEELPSHIARKENRKVFTDAIVVIKGDKQTDLLMNAAPIYDSANNLLGIVTAFEDISHLRGLEFTLQEQLRESVALYETQRALAEAEDADSILDTLLMQLAMQQPFDAYVFLNDDITSVKPVEVRHMMTAIDDIDALSTILTDELITVDDVETDTALDQTTKDELRKTNVRSLIVAPLRTRTRTTPIGWLMMVDTEPDRFTDDYERVLVSTSDMGATALDNSYLFQSTQTALQETGALYSATTTISRARTLTDLISALESAMNGLEPDMSAAFTTVDGTIQPLFTRGFDESVDNGLDLYKLAAMDLNYDDVVLIEDIANQPSTPFVQEVLNAKNIAAMVAVNLRIKDQIGGRLFIAFTDPHRHTEGDIRYLNTLADSASVVLDNQFLLAQVQSSLEEARILYEASRALIEVSTADEILEVVVNHIAREDADQVLIGVINKRNWDTSGVNLEIVAGWNREDNGMDLTGVTLAPDQFPAWGVFSTRNVLTIEDVLNAGMDEMEVASIESLDARSLVIIPLRTPNRDIGMIWISSRKARRFSEADKRTYQSFSEQSSLSLQSSLLLQQAERRARQLETSAVISQTVGQILDLDVLLPQVVDLIKLQFEYDHVQVFLMDADDEYAMLAASTGEAGKQLLSVRHKLAKGSGSVIGRVTETGEPTIALDTADANVIHQPNPYLPLTRSEMALPLTVKGSVVGALDVQSNEPNAFSEEDIQALTTLAAQISVAIDNARLYNEAAERANEMSFLFDITTTAATAGTLEQSLQFIAQSILDSLEVAGVAIYIPQLYADYQGNEMITLRAMALSSNTEEPMNVDDLPEVQLNDNNNLIGIVGNTLQPMTVSNISREVRYDAIVDNARAAILTPISTGSNLIGLIVMEGQRTNMFGVESQTLMLTLAGSIAAIIQNRQLVDELQASNERLVEIDRLKSQFLASMSHELRTPLNSIIGFSRVMLKGIDGPLTEMQEQDLNTIYTSGNHLLNLINDILDQAKIEANQMTLKFAHFEVKQMIETVRAIAIGTIKEKDKTGILNLNVDIASNLPKAYGDEFRSRQIIINLVTNAIKFTSEGAVTVRAYTVMNEQYGQKMIRIDVTDTGIGIAEKDMPILFEQFRQIDNSLTRTVGGTGLGLPISKSLTEMQGGEMIVSSELNVGSTFSITIPTEPIDEIVEQHSDHGSDERPAKPQSNGASSTSKTGEVKRTKPVDTSLTAPVIPNMASLKREVLLIEDNKDMVDQFRRTLQREGFDVQTADQAAYATAMVSNLRPNVVVMDVNFADGRGWDILAEMKDRDDTFDIPIIVTTTSEDSERAYQLGASRFLTRPFMPDDLVEAVLDAEKESNRERILIIDDQPDAIRLLTQVLGDSGNYRVFSADSGTEGISLVARRRPDLIILDLRMPDMDGFAVLNELRNNPETSKIPVMVVTGEVDFNDTEQEQLTNVHVLQKTDISQEDYNAFIERVRHHLGNGNGDKK